MSAARSPILRSPVASILSVSLPCRNSARRKQLRPWERSRRSFPVWKACCPALSPGLQRPPPGAPRSPRRGSWSSQGTRRLAGAEAARLRDAEPGARLAAKPRRLPVWQKPAGNLNDFNEQEPANGRYPTLAQEQMSTLTSRDREDSFASQRSRTEPSSLYTPFRSPAGRELSPSKPKPTALDQPGALSARTVRLGLAAEAHEACGPSMLRSSYVCTSIPTYQDHHDDHPYDGNWDIQEHQQTTCHGRHIEQAEARQRGLTYLLWFDGSVDRSISNPKSSVCVYIYIYIYVYAYVYM